MPAQTENLRIATVVGTHGIKGMLKVKIELENPDLMKTVKAFFNESGEKLDIVFTSDRLARLAGIETREAAAALRGHGIFITKDDLPKLKKGEFYAMDLIGKDVIFEDGKGKLTNVFNFGASDIFEVDGKYLVPFAEDFVTLEKEIVIRGKKEDFE